MNERKRKRIFPNNFSYTYFFSKIFFYFSSIFIIILCVFPSSMASLFRFCCSSAAGSVHCVMVVVAMWMYAGVCRRLPENVVDVVAGLVEVVVAALLILNLPLVHIVCECECDGWMVGSCEGGCSKYNEKLPILC